MILGLVVVLLLLVAIVLRLLYIACLYCSRSVPIGYSVSSAGEAQVNGTYRLMGDSKARRCTCMRRTESSSSASSTASRTHQLAAKQAGRGRELVGSEARVPQSIRA